MNKHLYPCFSHWPGTIWLYSDPHFGDPNSQFRREGITDEEQVRRINSKVGKTGTIIFLGDVGDVEFIKQIKGYKVLIMGNHDKGASNYKRSVDEIILISPEAKIDAEAKGYKKVSSSSCFYRKDNHLFDEVYEGTLQIADNIILSHEPINYEYCLNIHGHDHSGTDFINHVLKYYDADMLSENMLENYLKVIKTDKLTRLNICAEWINYIPVNIDKIIKSGILHNIPNVHREAIDTATTRKLRKLTAKL